MTTSESGYQEASDMLAEALKQMDGILAGTLKRDHSSKGHSVPHPSQNGLVENGPTPKLPQSPKLVPTRTIKLLNDLHLALEETDDQERVFRQLTPDTQRYLQDWVDQCSKTTLSNGFSGSTENLEDKIRKLENEKEDLLLQVSVLSDQIEAQVEKIHDLEKTVKAANNGNNISTNGNLDINGGIYTRELLNRNMTSHDPHKLDLMAENSNLKLRLATMEREKGDMEMRLQYAQKRMDDLQSRLNDNTIELSEVRSRVSKNGTIPSSPDPSDSTPSRTLDRERTLDRLKRKHSEVEKLKKAVETLMVTNSEKDSHIEELKRQMKRYNRIEELLRTTQGRRALDQLNLEDEFSDSSSTQNSSNSAHDGGRDKISNDLFDSLKPELRNQLVKPTATSTPVNSVFGSPTKSQGQPGGVGRNLTPPSHLNPTSHSPSPRQHPSSVGIGRSSSFEDVKPQNQTPPHLKRPGGPTFGAQSETEEEALKDQMAQEYKQLQQQNAGQQRKHKTKGIKRFFGKLRRSNSQDLDPDKVGDFKRSGLRATAGPRLGWSKDVKSIDCDIPFAHWDKDRVATWIHGLGLSMYIGDCKRWVKNGDHLLKATQQDLEKELGIRNHFHRKKLQLALQAIGSDTRSAMDDLDHNWVTRWLDDIGLPQYKDHFSDARIDGRMLHYLTIDDLVTLKVTNILHHLSIKRAIQVLRISDFNSGCLRRRPGPEEALSSSPSEVMLWSNHRVMDWLRSIDLSEYAPNLRGSGVHGGLMVLEARFSSELFASILSIPNNKTLLRRHLSTHYVELIGNEIQHKKRDLEAQPGFMPLTPNQKVKLKKRLFGHKRTRSIDGEEDLVCPIGTSQTNRVSNNSESNGSPMWNHELTLSRDNKENLLAKDRFLDSVPSSDV